jgi:hypothetical protein
MKISDIETLAAITDSKELKEHLKHMGQIS